VGVTAQQQTTGSIIHSPVHMGTIPPPSSDGRADPDRVPPGNRGVVTVKTGRSSGSSGARTARATEASRTVRARRAKEAASNPTCPTCGGCTVQNLPERGRSVFWCPRCQRYGSAPVGRS
jgi:hypothetical protein